MRDITRTGFRGVLRSLALVSITIGLTGCGAWIGGGILIASATSSGGGGGGGTTVVQAEDRPQVVELNLEEGSAGAERPDDLAAVGIGFRIIERSAEPADVSVEFSLDGFATVQSATIVNSSLTGLPTSADGVAQSLTWNAAADGLSGEAMVGVRVTAADTTGAGTAVTVTSLIGNLPPAATNLQVASTGRTGTIPFQYQLSDSAGDSVNVTLEFKLASEPDSAFRTLDPVVGSKASLPVGMASFAWDSLAPAPAGIGTTVADVVVRVIPTDTFVNGDGSELRLPPIRIENNQPPTAVMLFDLVTDPVGPVNVPFRILDAESDSCSVIVQWKSDSEVAFPDLNDPSLNPYVDSSGPRFVGNSMEDPAVRVAVLGDADVRAALRIVSELNPVLRGNAGLGSTAAEVAVPELAGDLDPELLPGSRLEIDGASGTTTATVTSAVAGRLILETPLPNAPAPGSALRLTPRSVMVSQLASSPIGTIRSLVWDAAADGVGNEGVSIRVTPFDLRQGASDRSVRRNRRLAASSTRPGLVASSSLYGRFLLEVDLNGDELPDLVVSRVLRTMSSEVAIFRRRLDGSLPQSADEVILDGGFELAAGDLNSDGRVDLALGQNGSVAIYLQDAQGAFQSGGFVPSTRFQGTTNSGGSVAIADVNGDQRDDIVTNDSGNGEVLFYFQDSQGQFGSSPSDFFQVTNSPGAVRLADFNDDDLVDVAVLGSAPGATTQTFVYIRPSASSSFPTTPQFTADHGSFPGEIAVGDLTGDGVSDLVFSNRDGLEVFQTNGADSMQSAFAVIPGGGSLTLGDFNGDGREDIAVTEAGLFGARDGVKIFFQGEGGFNSQPGLVVENRTTATAALDFDGDGLTDLIRFGNTPAVTAEVLLQAPAGGLGASPDVTVQVGVGARDLGVGDFNADGRADLVVLTGDGGAVEVFLQDLAGDLPVIPSLRETLTETADAIVVGDFDGDGDEDIAFSSAAGSRVLVVPQQQGGLAVAGALTLDTASTPSGLAVADFNGDGRLDLIVVCQSANTVDVFLQQATGLGAMGLVRVGNVDTPKLALGVDINLDGRRDLVIGRDGMQDNSLFVLQEAGGGFETTRRPLVRGSAAVSGIAIGDFIDSGFPGVVVAGNIIGPSGPFRNENIVVPPSGNLAFATRQANALNLDSRAVLSADLDGDGLLDIVTAFAGSPAIEVAFNSSTLDQKFKVVAARSLPAPASRLAVADVNGDGRSDILALVPARGEVLVFLQR